MSISLSSQLVFHDKILCFLFELTLLKRILVFCILIPSSSNRDNLRRAYDLDGLSTCRDLNQYYICFPRSLSKNTPF